MTPHSTGYSVISRMLLLYIIRAQLHNKGTSGQYLFCIKLSCIQFKCTKNNTWLYCPRCSFRQIRWLFVLFDCCRSLHLYTNPRPRNDLVVHGDQRRGMVENGTVVHDRRVRHGRRHDRLDQRHGMDGMDGMVGDHRVSNHRRGDQFRGRVDDVPARQIHKKKPRQYGCKFEVDAPVWGATLTTTSG